ncbi:uncharacterized protein N7484_000322 [Penicillium longicatenatum]|uniref:uncharacterized protein n=1 Tax=Penicillium longicatenatum TaxID=1561947 RepID=UPI002549153D|nr:uncharacterized protein N7484_000322 [Penicillium longicatenatum]KAJ5660950.1 hypothetical protein N7484_000322 [Penicillium longicatenatum]
MSSSSSTSIYDTIISGAGPVGLLLATELKLQAPNARVLVLERRISPDTTIKAAGINTASVEILERRGLLHAIQSMKNPLHAGQIKGAREWKLPFPRAVGHFGGIPVPAAPLDRENSLLRGRGKNGWYTPLPQAELERILYERGLELGVEVRRGFELTGMKADESGVTVVIEEEGKEGMNEVRGRWLVGCDGGHSLVRSLAGFDFPGTDPKITGRAAIVKIEGAESLGDGWQCTPQGVYVYTSMQGLAQVRTIEFDGPPADKYATVTAQEMESSLRRVTGVEGIRISTVSNGTRFTDNARQASTYRRGRVFLCGDAAHVHAPFSGQGLNLGLGDAVNLGWKLGAVLQGWGTENLLDTYTSERHPIGVRVLDWTRAQTAVMRGDPDGSALRSVVSDFLRTTDGATHYVKQISGLWQHYDLGDGCPLVGMTMPDIRLDDDTRLANHAHEGHSLLVDLTGNDNTASLVEKYAGRLKLVRRQSKIAGVDVLLVRPDGFVAWAATDGGVFDEKDLEVALVRWLGSGKHYENS